MEDLKKRIKYLKLAGKNINPLKEDTTYDLAVFLAKLQDEGLVNFAPDGKVNSSNLFEITDAGHKRLDEMKRSMYPDWLKWSALGGIVVALIFIFNLVKGN
jgi:hypothetical protein